MQKWELENSSCPCQKFGNSLCLLGCLLLQCLYSCKATSCWCWRCCQLYLLSLFTGPSHDGDSSLRESTVGGLARKHNVVGAIQHCIGYISNLCTCWPRSTDHGLQHLCGGDHRLASCIALCDDHLLCQEDLFERNLHTHVTAGHHDPISLGNDLIDIFKSCLVLDLGDDLYVFASFSKRLSDELHISGALHKAGSHEVHLLWNAEVHEVVNVLLLQNRQVHLHAWKVAILPFAHLAVVHHLGHYVVFTTRQHL
mmetsp:Transcript_49565/g.89051  ORF Transcript_49565/g.89051 Transcript_49565/m.89051 type:complete len:254 (+) Transcript_49565:302-1063(+)